MKQNQQNKIEEKTCEQALQALRDEIDKIDDQMVVLLAQRMAVILKVGELKKNNHDKFFIRSSREADMIKNLIKKSEKNFPKSLIVNIWRKIITAANMQEQPLHIAIHNPKNISDYSYLVREYYSDAVPFTIFDSATSVVAEIEKGEAQIGIFALPVADFEEVKKEDAKENWWISLANNRLGLRVFAKIPFVEFVDAKQDQDKVQLVAIAAKEPEKSAEDISLLYVEASKEISRSQILSALKEQGLNARILKSVTLHQVEGVVFYLVELAGFYLETDVVIKNFTKSKVKAFTKIIGHFAVPVKV